MAKVGFIGLGVMGSQMVNRLLSRGHAVTGYNRTRGKAQWLVEKGMQWADTPRAVASACDYSFAMVTNAAATAAITEGSDGLLAGLSAGKFFIDMSTISPAVSRALAAKVRERGADMVDAPVSGSVITLQEGKLSVMVAYKSGIARETAVEVLTHSAVASPMIQYRGPFVLQQPEEAWFDVNMMQKDMLLAMELGRKLNVPLPTTAVSNEFLTAARGMGWEKLDFAVIFNVLASMAGVEKSGAEKSGVEKSEVKK